MRRSNTTSSRNPSFSLEVESLEDRIMLSTVQVLASGDTGQEELILKIDGQVVDQFTVSQQEEIFTYSTPVNVSANQVRIEFQNDFYDPSQGFDRNLKVDWINIDGSTFQTEDESVFSVGAYRPEDGLAPGFGRSEYLNGNGYFQYSDSGARTLIEVIAEGQEGGEQFDLIIKGNSIGTFTTNTSQQTFVYQANDLIEADDVRIEFVNDSYDPANNVDRNLKVDQIRIDGQVYETETDEVYSTGTWLSGDGLTPGFGRGEFLTNNGYFQYSSSNSDAGSVVQVFARGDEGGEQFHLIIGGVTTGTFTTSTSNQLFSIQTTGTVAPSDVRIEFFNDQFDAANGIDTNLIVNFFRIDGVTFQTEDSNMFSTGTWLPNDGLTSGFGRGEYLTNNGYFQFGGMTSPDPVARYRVTFDATWSSLTHPNEFPEFAHFSGLIGATHNGQIEFWAPGETASQGIQDVSELGAKAAFSSEINSAINDGLAEFELSGGGIELSPDTVTYEFDAGLNHSLVTLVAMIAPSPDWFVGIHGISLIQEGDWAQTFTVSLAPYDAGTDSGVSFASPNDVTAPQELITLIDSGLLANNGSVAPFGTFRFDRIG